MTRQDGGAPTRTEVVVVGGGPAGLQAALSLGRVHRDTVLLDAGHYRNEAAEQVHNVLGHDGRTPAELRAMVRRELSGYPTVAVRQGTVESVTPDGEGFAVTVADGATIACRAVVLATGLRDELPQVPGLAGLWGTGVAHCPYCHGHELSGERVAVLGDGAHVPGLSLLLERMRCQAVVLTGAGRMEPQDRSVLDRLRVTVREEEVAEVLAGPGSGVVIRLGTGEELPFAAVFVAPRTVQSSPLPEALGLRLLPSGCVAVDDQGRTQVPGVYAAGDLAHRPALAAPLASVVSAAAAGQQAAATLDADLAERDLKSLG